MYINIRIKGRIEKIRIYSTLYRQRNIVIPKIEDINARTLTFLILGQFTELTIRIERPRVSAKRKSILTRFSFSSMYVTSMMQPAVMGRPSKLVLQEATIDPEKTASAKTNMGAMATILCLVSAVKKVLALANSMISVYWPTGR